MLTKERKMSFIGSIALLCATIIWGSSFFILKNSIDNLPTYFVLATRFSIGAIFFGIICIKQVIKITPKALICGFILGAILSAAYIFQTIGLKTTSPAKNAFLTAAYCILVPFVGWFILRKKPSFYNVAAAVLCLVGIGLISLEGSFSIGLGDGLTLISAIFYALQIIFQSQFLKKHDFRQLLFIELLTVGMICWIMFLFTEKMPQNINFSQWLPIIYLGICASCLAQFLQLFGQKFTSANNASIILAMESVFGAIFSIIFYKERPSVQMAVGFAIMFIAIILSETGEDIKNRLFRKKEQRKDGGSND